MCRFHKIIKFAWIWAAALCVSLAVLAQDGREGTRAMENEVEYSQEASETIFQALEIADSLISGESKFNIPREIINDAAGMAIIPGMIKAGFIAGATFGDGILMVQKSGNQWSPPMFVYNAEGSLGLQAGITRSDLILVFNDPQAIEDMYADKSIKFGADATATAGPVGAAWDTTTQKAAVYSYRNDNGLFAGVSVSGGTLSLDREKTEAYYSNPQFHQQQSLRGYYAEQRNSMVNSILNYSGQPGTRMPQPVLELQQKMDSLSSGR